MKSRSCWRPSARSSNSIKVSRTGRRPWAADRQKPDRHAWRHLPTLKSQASHRHRESHRHLPARARDVGAGADGRRSRSAAAAGNLQRRRETPGPQQTDHECRNRTVAAALALTIETNSLSKNEQRNTVHRSLYDRSQNQPLSRLWAHTSGDRTLAPDGKCRAACGDGAARGADERGWAGSARNDGAFQVRLSDSCSGGSL